eukprot:TRINITY_DN40610_c0_g1_i1.p1 TRINITY_DN40610_c0_g1~~TRINITY_DN40610_c0_g1_i1.p1  ORF type:complete len:334 (-),score=43.14 TRINITY_DN40610_c0_g1_i1:457-1458(-)
MACIWFTLVLLLGLLRLASSQSSCVPLNVCFAIDESGSISPTEFMQQTEALVAIAELLTTFAPGSTLSAVGFSTSAELVQAPTTDINGIFIPAIEANPQIGSSTSSGSGLLLCQTQLAGASDPRIIVLLTDGVDNETPFGTAVAPDIQNDGITIATVGVGDGINTADLQTIASSPDLFTFVDDFSVFLQSVEDIVETLCPEPECVNIDCAKCGQVLECYVNSGFPEVDQRICDVVLDESQFCTTRRGDGTACLQQCKGRQGVQCFTGTSFGSCPEMIGSNPKCMGGAARGRPADLSNFASYTVCTPMDGSVEVTCLNDKCESGSSCSCAQLFQ